MINEKQIKLIWVLARQLGLSSEQVHDLLIMATGKKSIKTLSGLEANQFIDSLIRAGAQAEKPKRSSRDLPPNVVELVRQKQNWKINKLVDQLGWRDDPDRLKGFMRRVLKRDRIVTKQDGIKIIEGLKGVLLKRGGGHPSKPLNGPVSDQPCQSGVGYGSKGLKRN